MLSPGTGRPMPHDPQEPRSTCGDSKLRPFRPLTLDRTSVNDNMMSLRILLT